MRRVTILLRNIVKIILLILVIGIGTSQFSVFASYSKLPPSMVVGDDEGIKVTSDGDYLIDVRNVEPGKKWQKKITLINLEKGVAYRLSMHISKPTLIEGQLDLSKAIQMTLLYEGKEVYQGPLAGVTQSVNLQDELHPLDLGIFKSGDSRMLEARFELDGEKYTNSDFFTKNSVENSWHFKAIKAAVPDGKEIDKNVPTILGLRLPQTGEEWSKALLYFCLGLLLLLVAILIINYQYNQRKTKNKKSVKK